MPTAQKAVELLHYLRLLQRRLDHAAAITIYPSQKN
jgi:hypothetical protein